MAHERGKHATNGRVLNRCINHLVKISLQPIQLSDPSQSVLKIPEQTANQNPFVTIPQFDFAELVDS